MVKIYLIPIHICAHLLADLAVVATPDGALAVEALRVYFTSGPVARLQSRRVLLFFWGGGGVPLDC